MATSINVLQTDDVVWTLADGALLGWKVAKSGRLVELATHEMEKMLRSNNTGRIFRLQ